MAETVQGLPDRRTILLGAAGGAAVLGLIVLGTVWASRLTGGEPFRRFDSADGRFAVVVLRREGWAPPLPGQAGASPGTIELRDASGRVLATAAVERVDAITAVDWGNGRAAIAGVVDWDVRALSR
jgi:hypothetical protein